MQRARGGEERCFGKPTRYIRRLRLMLPVHYFIFISFLFRRQKKDVQHALEKPVF